MTPSCVECEDEPGTEMTDDGPICTWCEWWRERSVSERGEVLHLQAEATSIRRVWQRLDADIVKAQPL